MLTLHFTSLYRMRVAALLTAILLLGSVVTVLVARGPGAAGSGARTLLGDEATVGHGTARTFVDLDDAGRPAAIGIALTEGALHGLATHMNTTSRCFDRDGSGHMSHGECLGDYEVVLELPRGTEGQGLPVRWATVNWNPEGHPAPAPPVWSAPHFDFHFYMAEEAVIRGIRPGPCGEFIDCDDFRTATLPLAPRYQPEDYIDVGAAVPAMGNHLVDAQDPELLDPSLGFSRTFIYGLYGGALIFLEPMVSHAFLSTRPDACAPVKAPAAYATAGYYPTTYCVRHDAASGAYRITLEGLVYRRAF